MRHLIERILRAIAYSDSWVVKQLVDQAVHFGAAFLFLAPAAFWGGVFGFAFAGFGIGLVREITEGDGIFNRGSLLDILFWTIGGAMTGLITGA